MSVFLCEANADCNAIESDASSDGGEGFCWMWLNGSCNLRVDDVGSVPGLLVWDENLDSSGFGAAGLHYQPNSVESLCASDLVFSAEGGATLEGSQVDDCRTLSYSSGETEMPGCTDSNALNYDSEATMDDDTCIYPCLEDEFVSSNACVPCPEGFINDSGDDPTGFDTQCDEVIENEYTVDVLYESDADIAGFQFNVDGADLISVSGGAADAAGFTVSSGGSTVLGFSFTGASIPAGGSLNNHHSIK